MSMVEHARVNRLVFEVTALGDDSGDRAYGKSRTPEERMLALELLRQIHYGYDPVTTRLQKVFEVVDLSRD